MEREKREREREARDPEYRAKREAERAAHRAKREAERAAQERAERSKYIVRHAEEAAAWRESAAIAIEVKARFLGR